MSETSDRTVPTADASVPGYLPEEVRTDQSTRAAKLKWVIVIDQSLTSGVAVNAVACAAAAVGASVDGLLGPGGKDASGEVHPGLPWAGCTILAASAESLCRLRATAAARDGVLVVDLPSAAQTSRVYDDYLDELSRTAYEDLSLSAVSIIGPRNKVDKIVGKLPLLR